ncbi:MAG: hypothetical protein IPI67_39340 [Myxococcales bacterium]|nr:hypothetical protein [Myxococcales bacterium]
MQLRRLAALRYAVPFVPLAAWGVLLVTRPRLWERVPRAVSGTAPGFAYIGTFAQLFACALFVGAPYLVRERPLETALLRVAAMVIAAVFLYIGAV